MRKQEQKANLCQRVYDHVKDQVMSLELKPGDKITEAMLVEELQISRTPIREGLRLLARDGVVTLYPNRFAEITVFSPKDIYDMGAVRISLDVLGSRLAVFRGSNADFSRLEKLAQAAAASFGGQPRVSVVTGTPPPAGPGGQRFPPGFDGDQRKQLSL